MAQSAYDDIAEWYDEWVGEVALDDPALPAVETLMGDVRHQRVCDLACGQGRIARRLATLGAHVTGVDLSARLLAIAARYEQAVPLGIEYIQDDARELRRIPDASFDGVLCFMALMDIAELMPALRGVGRILRPGGWFVFSILHPCYNPPPSGEQATETGWVRVVSGYWNEGYWRSDTRTGPPSKVGSFHRTLSTYINALAAAGLQVEWTSEPQAEGSFAQRRPVWAEVPAYLIVKCRKGSADRYLR